MRLHVAEKLTLPVEWMMASTVVYGAKGSGKTTFGSVCAEEVHAAGQRFCIIDVKGDWWGLKSSADGAAEAIPVVVFGGDHADVPLDPDAGAEVARLVSALPYSCVIDLDLVSKGKRLRFLARFFETLYEVNRDPLLLFLDEAQGYAPQQVKYPSPDATMCLGAVEDLVKQGRKHGLGVVVLTQRGSSVNKEVTELCDVMVAFRTPGALDQERVRSWLGGNVSKADVAEVLGGDPPKISGLPTGSAVFASNHPAMRLFGVYAVRPRATFDSSKTPSLGRRAKEPKRLAKPDLEALRQKMATAIERAAADDPKVLRARIVELERELKKRPLPEPQVTVKEIPVLKDKQLERAEKLVEKLQKVGLDIAGAIAKTYATNKPAREPLIVRTPTHLPRVEAVKAVPKGNGHSDGKLGRCERALLAVLAQRDTTTAQQLAILSEYSIRSSGFQNALGALRSAGFAEGSRDAIRITDAGHAAIGPVEPLPAGDALVAHWMAKLGKCERAVLGALVAAGPRGIATKEDLAERAQYSVTSSGFQNALGKLRTLQLVEGLRAAETLLS